MANTITSPTYSEVVVQRFNVEALNGPKDTFYYLTRFPDEIYTKTPDSRLYKYMRLLLGDQGVNWLKKNALQARLQLEEMGIETFNIDDFYGDPLQFGRILEESFDQDPEGLIPKAQWDQIRAQDAAYRSRAIDYVNGARAGNTPLGMRLVAKSGLGHDVEIIEEYKYLYDIHSDDPLGLDNYGQLNALNEMIVLPRREFSTSEIQTITIIGDPDYPDAGMIQLQYNGVNSNLFNFDATAQEVQAVLEQIYLIGPGNVAVSGGPGPINPWVVSFQGTLANNDVPELIILVDTLTYLGSDEGISIFVDTVQGGHQSTDEIVDLAPREERDLQEAVDRIKPVSVVMTTAPAPGIRTQNTWASVTASSEYRQVIRYATGNPQISWPPVDTQSNWVEASVEHEAPCLIDDLQYHYTHFHNVSGVETTSVHAGPFSDQMFQATDDQVFFPKYAVADYPSLLYVTSQTENVSLIDGMYPLSYQTLPGAPTIVYNNSFWSSVDEEGTEQLIVTLPDISAVNYLAFEIVRSPLTIDVEFDARDSDDVLWTPVTPVAPYNNVMALVDTPNWIPMGLSFTNVQDNIIFTRRIRLTFTRTTGSDYVRVRNLRVGRNVA